MTPIAGSIIFQHYAIEILIVHRLNRVNRHDIITSQRIMRNSQH